VLLAIAFLWGPLVAQRAITQAARAEANAEIDQAITDYRRAILLDGWYAEHVSIYRRIGEIEASLGHTSTAEYRIYYAENLVAQNQPFTGTQESGNTAQLPEAIALYDDLAAEGGETSKLARRRAAELWTEYGLHLFVAGAFGSAVEAWEKALAREPRMWLASFYLTRGYYVVGRYQDAAHLAESVAVTSDPVWFAILSCNMGDARMQMGDLDVGHRAYFDAYDFDYAANRRALYELFGL
jgi:tetratricopeptide (TPR) repeat protein